MSVEKYNRVLGGHEANQPAKANIVGVTRDRNFEGSVIVKTENEDGRIVGYALRKNRHGDWEGNTIGYMKDGSIGWVQQLHEADFPKLEEQGILDSYESMPAMKSRDLESPEMLDKKQASKKFLAAERAELALELRKQRHVSRDSLEILKTRMEIANASPEMLEGEMGDKQFGEFAKMQSDDAIMLANRLESGSGLSNEEAQIERGNVNQHVDNSERLKSIKQKIDEHYAKADAVGRRKYEAVRKNVDQVMLRNDAFIVHAFLTNEGLRHNSNSNISGRATLEDDLDILLSLEPSVSASSIKTGSRHGLWSEKIGVLIGGGEIMGGAQTDNQTQAGGIKYRNGTPLNSGQIDKLVSDKKDRSYNELVVDNPKVFGFYQTVTYDASGNLMGFEARSSEDAHSSREEFLKYMDMAMQKGMPQLILTPDRHVFEFRSIDANGVVTIGQEITPQQVAAGAAGLSGENRKTIGQGVISKNLFKYLRDQKKAKEIIAGASEEEVGEDMEFTRDEYVEWLKANGDNGGFRQLPDALCEDKEFMLEVAHINPNDAYSCAGDELKEDIDFIKRIYSAGDNVEIYRYLPEDLKKNEAIAEMAIDNNDLQFLQLELADIPAIWNKIIDKLVDNANPESYFDHGSGNERFFNTDLIMYKGGIQENVGKRIASDQRFVNKLNELYPDYKFETDEYSRLMVTKLPEK